MIVPRIGALILLVGFGFAASSVGRLMYVTAREGYSSWLPVLGFLAPTAIVAFASCLLVLKRNPLGVRLVIPLALLVAASAIITFLSLPPVGRFLDDYERAALARGVDVPPYLAAKGLTPAEYVDNETGEIRSQGTLGAIAAIAFYVLTVWLRTRRGRVRARTQASAKR